MYPEHNDTNFFSKNSVHPLCWNIFSIIYKRKKELCPLCGGVDYSRQYSFVILWERLEKLWFSNICITINSKLNFCMWELRTISRYFSLAIKKKSWDFMHRITRITEDQIDFIYTGWCKMSFTTFDGWKRRPR